MLQLLHRWAIDIGSVHLIIARDRGPENNRNDRG